MTPVCSKYITSSLLIPGWRLLQHGGLLWSAGSLCGPWECEFETLWFYILIFLLSCCMCAEFHSFAHFCRNVTHRKQQSVSAIGRGSSWTPSWLRTQKVHIKLNCSFIVSLTSCECQDNICLLDTNNVGRNYIHKFANRIFFFSPPLFFQVPLVVFGISLIGHASLTVLYRPFVVINYMWNVK